MRNSTMINLNKTFYMKIRPGTAPLTKSGRTTDKKYLVIGMDMTGDKFEFINDFDDFDFVEKHYCVFAGFDEEQQHAVADGNANNWIKAQLGLLRKEIAELKESQNEKNRGKQISKD